MTHSCSVTMIQIQNCYISYLKNVKMKPRMLSFYFSENTCPFTANLHLIKRFYITFPLSREPLFCYSGIPLLDCIYFNLKMNTYAIYVIIDGN